jgi:hypothetical protein
MFPNASRTAIPPLPPEIQAQQQQQQQPVGHTFAQMGAMGGGSGMPNPVDVLEGQLAKLESWAQETAPLTNQLNPALTTLLVPIAQAGKALQSEIAKLKQQTAGPSPQVMGSVPPNVPGNIPGARPAM